MVPLFDAIILDVAVIALLLIIIVIGAVKGFMHTIVNFVLLAGAVALGFSPFIGFIKNPVTDLLSSKIILGVGVGDEVKLAIYLLYPFMASLIISLGIYLVLRIIKLLICVLVKHRLLKDNRLPKRVSKVSRAFGGVFGLLLYGVVIILTLSIFNKPLIGGNKIVEKSYVVKYIESADDIVAELLIDEKDFETFEGTVIVKLVLGDLYHKVSQENIEDLNAMGEMVAQGALAIEDLKDVKVKVNYLHHFLRLVTENCLTDKGEEVDGFEKLVESSRNVVTKVVNEINALHGENSDPIDVGGNTMAVSKLLSKLGLNELVPTFEKIFIIK